MQWTFCCQIDYCPLSSQQPYCGHCHCCCCRHVCFYQSVSISLFLSVCFYQSVSISLFLVRLTLSTRAQILVWHDGTLWRTTIKIYSRWKRGFYENGIKRITIKQLKLYSVTYYFIITCMLSSNFKVALIFFNVV